MALTRQESMVQITHATKEEKNQYIVNHTIYKFQNKTEKSSTLEDGCTQVLCFSEQKSWVNAEITSYHITPSLLLCKDIQHLKAWISIPS